MVDELRREFHDRLGSLHSDVAALASEAAASVFEVTQALLAADPAMAGRVVRLGHEAVLRAASVEREVFDLLARQAPVGRDLRLMLATLRVSHEVELSTQLAASIADRIGRLDPGVMSGTLRALLGEMGQASAGLLERSAQAYAVLDPGLATLVVESAGPVRELQRGFLASLFALRAAPVESAVELGIVSRCYERIADHAVEIAERTRFVDDGVVAAP